jgi:hypothetical protein
LWCIQTSSNYRPSKLCTLVLSKAISRIYSWFNAVTLESYRQVKVDKMPQPRKSNPQRPTINFIGKLKPLLQIAENNFNNIRSLDCVSGETLEQVDGGFGVSITYNKYLIRRSSAPSMSLLLRRKRAAPKAQM